MENIKKFKHYIITRCLYANMSIDGKIYEFTQDIIDYWLNIIKFNLIQTLINSQNHNFEFIILTSERYKEILFKNLELNKYPFKISIIEYNLLNKFLAEDRIKDKRIYEIQSRIDIDDFIDNQIITDLQSKISYLSDKDIFIYGYIDGFCYDFEIKKMFKFYNQLNNTGLWSIMASLFLNPKNKKINDINIYTFNHGRIKLALENILKKRNFKYEDINIYFKQSDIKDAFIYFRSLQSGSNLVINNTNKFNIKPSYCSLSIDNEYTKKFYQTKFGFNYEL